MSAFGFGKSGDDVDLTKAFTPLKKTSTQMTTSSNASGSKATSMRAQAACASSATTMRLATPASSRRRRLSSDFSASSGSCADDSDSDEGADLDAAQFYDSLRKGIGGLDIEDKRATQEAARNAAASPSYIPGIVTIRARAVTVESEGEAIESSAPRLRGASVEHDGVMYFGTGVHVNDLLDAKEHPPAYKVQYTVTGAVRKVKDKKNWVQVGKKVEVNGLTLALFRFHRTLYAMLDKCPHQGGPLSGGDVIDIEDAHSHVVSCPYHGWKFDLKTGACDRKDDVFQPVYPVKVIRGGQIAVGFRDIDTTLFADNDF